MLKIIVGDGVVSFLVDQFPFMFIYTRFITLCSKQSKSFFIFNLFLASHFRMYGLFQTVFYFGYMGLFSIALGVLCGTVGYISTASFIHKIYSRIKLD